MVFLHKERFAVGTYIKLQPRKYRPFRVTLNIHDIMPYDLVLSDFMNISNTFIVAEIH